MSVTESKAKTERKSSRKPAKTQETVLSALLAQTEEVSVPLASLIKSPLNVRTVPYSAESVSELADSIKGVGLLQNLVVHALPGDRYGVAAGGRRLAALNMLAERDIIQVDWPVRVKVIPQELATAASMTENGHRRDMCTLPNRLPDSVQWRRKAKHLHKSVICWVIRPATFSEC